eukprot:TRINITY_DN12397_c4_g1_i1.p2 TRINITY_DN12397_c4_g1~~TRINITY_DN12397_c4_g1_i1.p2  ORF type:complete len:376 (+),score=121.03 TRINITY_DN12397_c4_g1_i1:46-1173(+)
MYKLDLPSNTKDEAIITARRHRLEERKQHLHNSTARKNGADINALAQQIEEKQARQRAAKEAELAADLEMLEHARLGMLAEKEAAQRRRAALKADLDFHRTQQGGKAGFLSTNWDGPVRSDDPEEDKALTAKLGPSSLQQFDGEDMSGLERAAQQRAARREATRQQLMEHQRKQQAELEEQMQAEKLALEQAAYAEQVQKTQEQERRQRQREASEWNLRMAEQKRAAAKTAREQEWATDRQHMATEVSSDLLAEDPNQAKSYGPRTVIPDRFRGMSQEQIAAIRREQQEQAEQARQIKQQEQQALQSEAAHQAAIARQALLIERQAERERHQALQATVQENQNLLMDQTARRTNRDLSHNDIAPAFYEQFGRDAR